MALPLAIATLAQPVLDVVKHIIKDPDLQAQIEAGVVEKQVELEKAGLEYASTQAEWQNRVNVEQAKSPSFIVAGMRPSIGWGALAILMYAGIFRSAFNTILASNDLPLLEPVSGTVVGWAVALLFGLCGIRGFETVKGVARQNLKYTPANPNLDK